MPFNLTTPFTVGDLDPGVSYPKVRITNFALRTHPTPRIVISYEMGSEDEDGKWVTAQYSQKTEVVQGEDFAAMVGASADLYTGVKAAAYAHLVSIGAFTGEVA